MLVLGIFIVFFMMTPKETKDISMDSTKQLITQFTKSGEYIGLDADPSPPVSKYTYQPKQVTNRITLSNGTEINRTSTVYEQVETKEISSVLVDAKDRKLNISKICKFGIPCDLTGKINLIDPVTEQRIPAPYAYLITIDCDYRDFCNLNPSRSSNEVTFPDGSFKYTWTPAPPVTKGDYRVTVYSTSHYTNVDGEDERRQAFMSILVIE